MTRVRTQASGITTARRKVSGKHFRLETRSITEGIAPYSRHPTKPLVFFIDRRPKQKKPERCDLSAMAEYFGDQADAAAETLVRLFAMGTGETSRGRRQTFKNFLKWLGQSEHGQEIAAANDLTSVPMFFRDAVHAWAGEKKAAHSESPATATLAINALNRCLQLLMRTGQLPHFRCPRGARNSTNRKRPRPSLAEQAVVQQNEDTPRLDVVIQAMTDEMNPDDRDEAEQQLRALARLVTELPGSPEGLLEALKQLEEAYLLAVRKQASKLFRDWQSTRRRGRELLEVADPALAKRIVAALNGIPGASAQLRSMQPTFTRDELTAATLLAYETDFGSIPATEKSVGNRSFLLWLHRATVGRYQYDAMLGPNAAAVCAAAVLTLCETAVNVATLLELDANLGLQPSPTHEGVWLLTSLKRRAGNQFVIHALSEHSPDGLVSAVSALKEIAVDGVKLRDALGVRKLFVFRHFEEPSLVSEQLLRYHMKSATAGLGRVFTPSAIRPCVLTLHGLTKRVDALIVKTIAGHSEDSFATSSYQFRLASRVRVSAYKRSFDKKLQELLSKSAAGESLDEEPIADVETERDVFENMMHIVVDINEPLILDAHLTMKCLDRSAVELTQQRTTHWMDSCEPALAWSQVILEKAAKGELAHRVSALARKADALIASGFVHFLE